MQKTSFIKIYSPGPAGVLLNGGTIKDAKWDPFVEQINAGLGNFSFYLAKKFDDFGEGYLIKANNRVELYISDGDTGSIGRLMYSGYISTWYPKSNDQGVKIDCLGYFTKYAKSTLRTGTTYLLKTSSTAGLGIQSDAQNVDISAIIKALVDLNRANVINPMINYNTSSIPSVGANLTYTFQDKRWSDVIAYCRDNAPANYWFYCGADNILQFKPKPSTPKHKFTLGKSIFLIDPKKGMEPVINRVIFKDQDSNGVDRYTLYHDTTSEGLYDDIDVIVSDNRITTTETKDNYSNNILGENKDMEADTVLTIFDNNGNKDFGYDIESIQVGDTCQITNINTITSKTFSTNMQIVKITRSMDSVICELENLRTNLSRTVASMQKAIQDQSLNTGSTNSGGFSTGDIKMSLNKTPDSGFLIFNGQTVSRILYSGLWAWVQANSMIKSGGFGSGDGSTTFTLPNYSSRLPMMSDNDSNLATIGGTDTINLQHRHYNPHGHGVNSHNHGNTGYVSSDHVHGTPNGAGGRTSGQWVYSPNSGSQPDASRDTHNHGNTYGISANHYHGTGDAGSYTGGSDTPYSDYQLPTNVSVINPFFKVYYFIKY